MIYRYEAARNDGTPVEGTLEAESEARAEEVLWQANLTILSLKRQRQRPALDELIPSLFGVKRADLLLFSRQLALLLDAGIGILGSLRILQDQIPKASFKRLIRRIETDLQTGHLFSETLASHPDVFPTLYVRLAQVGESTGNLQAVLRQLARHLQREGETRSKVQGALAYPAFILVLAGLSVFVMINFVLPSLMTLFSEFNADLPAPTKFMLALVKFSQAYGLYVGIALGALVAGLTLALRTGPGQYAKDFVLLHIPVVGEIIRKSSLAHFARTMGMLVASGVSIMETLDMVVRTSDNLVLRRALTQMRTEVIAGRAISEALRASSFFPPMVTQMVRVGEETGTLESNLESVAILYDEDTDRAIGRLTGMIEPALIVMVGVLVGFVAVSIISPIYSVMQQIK